MIRNNRRGKVAAVHALKACRGSGGVGPLLLNLGTRWSRVGNITHRLFYVREGILGSTECCFTSGNEFWDQLNRRMLVPKIRSGSFEEHKSLVPDCVQTSDVSLQRVLYADYAIPAREGVCRRKYMSNTIPDFFHEGVKRVTLNIRVESIRTWEQNTGPLKYEIRADHSTVTFCDVELRPLKGIHPHRSGSLTSIGGNLVRTDYWLWLRVTHLQWDMLMGQQLICRIRLNDVAHCAQV